MINSKKDHFKAYSPSNGKAILTFTKMRKPEEIGRGEKRSSVWDVPY